MKADSILAGHIQATNGAHNTNCDNNQGSQSAKKKCKFKYFDIKLKTYLILNAIEFMESGFLIVRSDEID